MATAMDRDNPDTHTTEGGEDETTIQARGRQTHLRDLLNRAGELRVPPGADSSLVALSDEETEVARTENLNPLETCYKDIADLNVLMRTRLAQQFPTEFWVELSEAAMACDNRLKAIKQREKVEDKPTYLRTHREYNSMYYTLNDAMSEIVKRIEKCRKAAAAAIAAAAAPSVTAGSAVNLAINVTTAGAPQPILTLTSAATAPVLSTTTVAGIHTVRRDDREAGRAQLLTEIGAQLGHGDRSTPFGGARRRVDFQQPLTSTPATRINRDIMDPDVLAATIRNLQDQIHDLQASAEEGGFPEDAEYSNLGEGSRQGGARPYRPYIKHRPMSTANFKGDYASFKIFKQEFKQIYEVPGMSNIDLAMRLFSQLEGEPKGHVKDLYQYNLDADCYENMWDILDTLYGGPEVENSAVISQIYLQRSMASTKAVDVTSFYDFLTGQMAFWSKEDPDSLTSPRNGIYKMIKLKMSEGVEKKYNRALSKKAKPDCLKSLYEWVKELHKDGVGCHKKTETRKLAYEFAEYLARPNRPPIQTQRPPAQANRRPALGARPNMPAGRQAGIKVNHLDGEGNYEGNYEDEYNGYYPQTEEDDFEADSDEEVIQLTKAEMKAWLQKAKEEPALLNCTQCKANAHKLEHCNAFKELNVNQRNAYIKDRGLCFHCLDGKHRVRDCTVREGIKCPKPSCDRYHHPLLHSTATQNLIQHARFPEEELLRDLSIQYGQSGTNENDELKTTIWKPIPVNQTEKAQITWTNQTQSKSEKSK
jgi:hypothetical protein